MSAHKHYRKPKGRHTKLGGYMPARGDTAMDVTEAYEHSWRRKYRPRQSPHDQAILSITLMEEVFGGMRPFIQRRW